MSPRFLAACTLGFVLLGPAAHILRAHAAEEPSFLQKGEVFCTDEDDFEGYRLRGRLRTASAAESCVLINQVTRVVVLQWNGRTKSMIRVVQGPWSAHVGWTNGALPLAGG